MLRPRCWWCPFLPLLFLLLSSLAHAGVTVEASAGAVAVASGNANANAAATAIAGAGPATTSKTPASTAPSSKAPASTTPSSTAPASTAPASTAPASTTSASSTQATGIPSCATDCVSSGLQSIGCATTNLTCGCSDWSSISSIRSCVESKCDSDDANTTRNLFMDACGEEWGGGFPGGSFNFGPSTVTTTASSTGAGSTNSAGPSPNVTNSPNSPNSSSPAAGGGASKSAGSSLSAGALAGIAVGCAIVVFTIVSLLWLLIRERRHKSRPESEDGFAKELPDSPSSSNQRSIVEAPSANPQVPELQANDPEKWPPFLVEAEGTPVPELAVQYEEKHHPPIVHELDSGVPEQLNR